MTRIIRPAVMTQRLSCTGHVSIAIAQTDDIATDVGRSGASLRGAANPLARALSVRLRPSPPVGGNWRQRIAQISGLVLPASVGAAAFLRQLARRPRGCADASANLLSAPAITSARDAAATAAPSRKRPAACGRNTIYSNCKHGDSMRLPCAFAARGLALALTLAAATAAAQSNQKQSALTLYGAYRDGGSFIDVNSDKKLRLDGSSAWAISFDKGLDGSSQLQFYVSYQNTQLGVEQSLTAPPVAGTPPAPLPIKVIYLHFGGTSFFDGPIGQGPYVVGGLGATLFMPGLSGYNDELRPSMNIGIGYQVPLGERVALRFEARGYLTLVNSSSGLFCSGGCAFAIKGDAVTQGEVQLGLSYRF